MSDFLDKYANDIDTLTDLYRRNVITEYMEHLITENIPFSFVMLDVDNFKLVNDTYGHLAGDEVLKSVADSIRSVVGDRGVVGRYGGDEFVGIFPNTVEYQDIWQICYEILKSSATVQIPGCNNLCITYTSGVSRFPENASNIDDVITLADKALYRGKIKGRNCFIIYLPEKHANIELQSIREKVYSPMNLHSRIHSMLTASKDVRNNVKRVINFLGPYLMIDHLCIESNGRLLFEYHHPLAPVKQFEPFGDEAIKQMMNPYGIMCENTVVTSKLAGSNDLMKKFDEQKIFSEFLCKITAFGNEYGYLRAEMTQVDTGRIWQSDDQVLLQYVASIIALILYAKDGSLS